MRGEYEEYGQDRLGNVKRLLDPVRGTDGMEEGNGLVEVSEGDVDEMLELMVIPEDVEGFHLEEIHVYNSTDTGGTVQFHDVTLDDEGAVYEAVARSTPILVKSMSSRSLPYTGREFTRDIIAVEAGFEGWVGIGGYTDRPEYLEPEVEYGGLTE